jgi:hypothetical protein
MTNINKEKIFINTFPSKVSDYITNFNWNIPPDVVLMFPTISLLVLQITIPDED